MNQQTEAIDETVTHEGGCACGAFRFRAIGRPLRVGMCHCMTCRRVHGSAFGSYVIYHRGNVEFSGRTSTWRSSDEGRRHFCPECGSVAYMEYVTRDEVDVPLGAFDLTGVFEPAYELWCRASRALAASRRAQGVRARANGLAVAATHSCGSARAASSLPTETKSSPKANN